MQTFYSGTNRIADAIGRQQARIDKLVESGTDLQGNPIKATLDNLDREMYLSPSDHAAFQNQQAKATNAERLNTDEGLLVSNALGEYHNADNGGWQDGIGLATKMIITQMISELLGK